MTDTSSEKKPVKASESNIGFYLSIFVFLAIFFAVIIAQMAGF